jgi:MFS family permease
MTGEQGQRTRWRVWGVVGLLALAHMMAFVDRFALSAAAGPVQRAFTLSETELGALQGLAIALPYAAVALPLGALADRWAPQRMILAGLVVWTAGGFACAFSTSAVQLWAARMLIGAGQAAFVPASLALLGSLFQGAAAAPISMPARPWARASPCWPAG